MYIPDYAHNAVAPCKRAKQQGYPLDDYKSDHPGQSVESFSTAPG